MIPKERFICALKGGVPDRVPMFEIICSQKNCLKRYWEEK